MSWQILAWAMTGCWSLAATPAVADVIEVGSNGIATVYSRPTLFLGDSPRPVLPPESKSTKSNPPASPPAPPSQAQKLSEPAYPLLPHPVLDGYMVEAGNKYGVSPILVRAVAWQESRFRDSALSRKGAIGVMQLMPETASWLGVDPYNPRENIFGGVAYLAMLLERFGGNIPLALAAYNAGPEAVSRHRGIPPYRETQNYVKAISERLSIR